MKIRPGDSAVRKVVTYLVPADFRYCANEAASTSGSTIIPSDSKFTMELDFFGNASINIIPGTNEQTVENGSRVAGSEENEGQTDLAPITRIVSGFFNQKEKKQDSLLIELRRLNENLEKLLHKDNRSGGH